jgi:Domain of unknown function (DUF4249)
MKIKSLSYFLASSFLFFACEKEFVPDLPTISEEIVVEGYIEAGLDATPPYVILTRSLPFFKELTSFNNVFVEGAEVWISNGTDSTQLQEFCWKNLDPSVKKQAALFFGINADSVSTDFNFCVYIDFTQKIKGEIGKTYSLRIKTKEGKVLTSKTTIPRAVKIDTIEFIKPPGINQNDTMAQARATVTDPKGIDFYRYFTSINGSSYIAGANSVTDDAFFDGQVTKFNLLKSEPRGSGSGDNFGLFRRGDTVSIKFAMIDKAHFDFWSTLEFNANNGGPFASYTRVKHNISGGLGIWGGSSATYYDVVVPKK